MPAEQGAEEARSGRARDARLLLRAARSASLATTDEGDPFVSLVTPGTAPDLAPLLLLSDLSAHTRHLRADPRCALLAVGTPVEVNPQTAPRLSVTARAAIADDPDLRARYLAQHPYAALYAGFADFHLWRLEIEGALLVGGFARAFRIRPADLRPDKDAAAAIATAEAAILAHCNRDHAGAMARIAARPGEWRLVAVDADGCDLACGDIVLRRAWPIPVAGPDDVRAALIALTRG
ncbi:MAG: pyridoxamine 5'-phosphate oxidase family protein [Rhodospirillales bacterium]|nr:pyridoxamine 5'-phosphate oxidase family protein [Rhodospirillales bacterium]